MPKEIQASVVLSDLPPGDTRRASNPPPGQDLRFSYRSDIDDSDQPYALYVPSAYDPARAWPLVVNLHGSSAGASEEFVGQTSEHYGADENALFLWAAERHGALLLTPHGRGITEFRGIGENDVFVTLSEVRQRYNVDPDRISITGLSMGGTGSSEISLHRPDVFSAAAPIGAAYSFPWLAPNGRHLPFWCIGGENDRNFNLGGKLVAPEMEALGYPARLDIRMGRGHSDFVAEYFDGVVEWLVKHRLVKHPREYAFGAVLPMYGQAYWTAIDAIERPGTMGTLRASLGGANSHKLATDNISRVAVLPDSELVDHGQPMVVDVDDVRVFDGRISPDQEVQVSRNGGVWEASLAERRRRSLTDYRTHPVAHAPQELRMDGLEPPLANWITDAMRIVTGADIALYSGRHYRGLPVPKGAVDEVDLLHASRPFEQYLAVAELTGNAVLDTLEANVPDPGGDPSELVQISGASYTFDQARPKGSRLVDSDIDPTRTYQVALEGQVPDRQTIDLAGHEANLKYRRTDIPLRGALYAHALSTGKIEARAEGRVRSASAATR